MAGTKCRFPHPDLVVRWIAAGYGQDDGASYKPSIYVRDVPTIGTSSMLKVGLPDASITTYLGKNLRSNLETEYSRSSMRCFP